jgi:transposase
LPSRTSGYWRTQEREDFRSHRTLAHTVRLSAGHRLNASTYLGFLEQLARRYRRQGAIMIQDNASYHKDAEVWGWFKSNRHWLEVHQLPPYSPELNPTERLWQHTRTSGTHNRFFAGVDALVTTLTRVFGEMQSHPQLIRSYLAPFC